MTRRLLIAALLVLVPQLSQAFPITWQFNGTGTVNRNPNPFGPPDLLTLPLQMTFSFDSTAGDSCDAFPNLPARASVYSMGRAIGQFGSLAFTQDAFLQINNIDGHCDGSTMDTLIRLPGLALPLPAPGGSAFFIFAALGGLPVIPDGALLTALPFEGYPVGGTGGLTASGRLTTLPEPSTLLLIGGGLAALFRRRTSLLKGNPS